MWILIKKGEIIFYDAQDLLNYDFNLPARELQRIKVPTLFAELIRKSKDIKGLWANGHNRCGRRSENEDSIDFSELWLDEARCINDRFSALDVSVKAVEEKTCPRASNGAASSASTHRWAPKRKQMRKSV